MFECVCEVFLSFVLYFFIVSVSCLRNLIFHVMSNAVSSIKKMQTADKSATTGKLASSGQMLSLAMGATVELCMVLFVLMVVVVNIAVGPLVVTIVAAIVVVLKEVVVESVTVEAEVGENRVVC